jgi:glutathione S-transferase
MNQELLMYYVVACFFLSVKMSINSIVQGYGRFRYKSFNYPEDQPYFRTDCSRDEPMPEILYRAQAAWRNDLENIPIFFVAALCGLLAGVPLETYRALLLMFCLARALHSVSFYLALQPWRFIGYLAGQVSTIAMFCYSLVRFFG